ncbi:polymer-forming cytoskeletal protein [Hydrogenophaga sp.]|uniref:bactofilin family protein n=1 Tax=Hydrogenophaga sp. TaxID=1904254 RepID=UPI00356B5DD0
MKAKRYLKPDRHFENNVGNANMNDDNSAPSYAPQNSDGSSSENGYNEPPNEPEQVLEVSVGNAMPTLQPAHMPLLQADADAPGSATSQARSMVAEGMRFVGNAELRGPCSVAGHVEGNLTQAPNASVAVVVTETGRVKGDITAQKISVMGHTDGILDSGQGEVSLHDTASVHGLVRYGRIQVNGADLNATLERVAPGQNPA